MAIPYYWNIAPNRDATFTPQVSTRRGLALETEFRYLAARLLRLDRRCAVLPNDTARRSARAIRSQRRPRGDAAVRRLMRSCAVMRVSDDDYWKDFPGELKSVDAAPAADRPPGDTPVRRLDDVRAHVALADAARRSTRRPGSTRALRARAADRRALRRTFCAPASTSRSRPSSTASPNPDDHFLAPRQTGVRTHAARQHRRGRSVSPGWYVTPKALVQRRDATRSIMPLADGLRAARRASIPTLSVDSAWTLERDASFFGRAVRQTLEPRLFYVNTPYRGHEQTCRTSTLRPRTSTSIRSSPRTRSRASTASPTSNQLTAGVTSRIARPGHRRRGAARRHRAALPLARPAASRPTPSPLTQRGFDAARPRLDDAGAALELRRVGPVQSRQPPHPALACRLSLFARPVPHGQRDDYRLTRGLVGAGRGSAGSGRSTVAPRPAERAARAERRRQLQRHALQRRPGSTTACATAGSPTRSSASSTTPAAGSAGSSSSGCSTGRSEATTRLLLQLELVGLSHSDPIRSGS